LRNQIYPVESFEVYGSLFQIILALQSGCCSAEVLVFNGNDRGRSDIKRGVARYEDEGVETALCDASKTKYYKLRNKIAIVG
jgi:hypothetical protein